MNCVVKMQITSKYLFTYVLDFCFKLWIMDMPHYATAHGDEFRERKFQQELPFAIPAYFVYSCTLYSAEYWPSRDSITYR